MERMSGMYVKYRNAMYPCVSPSSEPSPLEEQLIQQYKSVAIKKVKAGQLHLIFELLELRYRGAIGKQTVHRAAVLIGTELNS